MPMGPWHTDDRPTVPGVYCTRAGCLEAHADLDQYPPREGGRVIRWREVLDG